LSSCLNLKLDFKVVGSFLYGSLHCGHTNLPLSSFKAYATKVLYPHFSHIMSDIFLKHIYFIYVFVLCKKALCYIELLRRFAVGTWRWFVITNESDLTQLISAISTIDNCFAQQTPPL